MNGNKSHQATATTRERIIDAALSEFANGDFSRATMRHIAKEAGIAQATIYKHFESKEQLLEAIITEKVGPVIDKLNEHLCGLHGTLTKLRKMTWYYLRYFQLEPQVAWLLYITISYRIWYKLPEAYPLARESGRALRKILLEGQEIGEIRKDVDIHLATRMYFGCLRLITSDWLVLGQSPGLTNISDNFAEMFFNAVRTEERLSEAFRCPFAETRK